MKKQMLTYFSLLILIVVSTYGNGLAQSKQKHLEKLFAGKWVDKTTARCLEISFDDSYATISDWNSSFQKKESGDVYKALLKDGKLVIPEDTDHHAPYSEIVLKNNALIYLTKPIGISGSSSWSKQIFSKTKN